METALTCFFCGRLPPATASEHFRCNNASPSRHVHFSLPPSFVIGTHRLIRNATNTNETKVVSSTNVKSRRRRRRSGFVDKTCQTREVEEGILHQNGDPIGKKDLGKSVIRWIRDSMRAMASDLAAAELEGGEGEFELWERMGPGLTFIMLAQPYLNAVPMPIGLEGLCLKACTHYPTLFDHFQRELRQVLRDSFIQDWRDTKSWKLLKDLANSGFYSFLPTFYSKCYYNIALLPRADNQSKFLNNYF